MLRDLLLGLPFPQFDQPSLEPVVVSQQVISPDRATRSMATHEAARPVNFDVDEFRISLDFHDDPFDETADHHLAVGGSDAGGVPECGQVAGQRQDLLPLRRRQLSRLFRLQTIHLFLNPPLVADCLFPLFLQFPGDQAVVRIDGILY